MYNTQVTIIYTNNQYQLSSVGQLGKIEKTFKTREELFAFLKDNF